jgi:excisionase family DNA binding protein
MQGMEISEIRRDECYRKGNNSVSSRDESATTSRNGSAWYGEVSDGVGDRLLDVNEVAEYLRVSRSSVYKMIERGEIPAIRLGRLLRVNRADLETALRNMS